MTGTLTLQGGNEHTPGCEVIDRRLRVTADTRRPLVLVVPLASSTRTVRRTVATAHSWWSRLDTEVRIAPFPHGTSAAHRTHPVDAVTRGLVEHAWLIVLTGGVPDRLLRRLRRSSLWPAVFAAWRRGTHLSGSSSGAMVMGQWMQSVRPPFPLRAGLGVLPATAVAPHYNLRAIRTAARARAQVHPRLEILGIDDRTALTGGNGVFTVVGAGGAAVVRGDRERVLRPGDTLRLGSRIPAPSRAPAVPHVGATPTTGARTVAP